MQQEIAPLTMQRRIDAALAVARASRPRFVRELAEFVRFDSVSAEPARRARVVQCAQWLAGHLHRIGLQQVRVVRTAGHPIVTAGWFQAPPRPTLLIYGHYDVTPPGPGSAWSSPPFTARVQGPRLFGRGASDDKGQMWAHIKAIESMLGACGSLPLRVKCIFDGEEEIGSPHLLDYLARHPQALAADVAVVSDMPMLGLHRPALTESMRGMLSVQVQVEGAPADLHSGLFGGAIDNPLHVLCGLLSSLHGSDGRVTLPGFYDRVRDLPAPLRAQMARAGPSDAAVLRAAGVARGAGEHGYTAYERITIRPALNVSGITAGQGSSAAKAIIAATAKATIDLRLVPDQDVREIGEQLRRHLVAAAPPTVRLRTRTLAMADPVTTPRSGPATLSAIEAVRASFGVDPVFIRSGGTVPVVAVLQRAGIPTVLMGLALPADHMHAPDERLYLPNLHKGIAASIQLMVRLAQRRPWFEEAAP